MYRAVPRLLACLLLATALPVPAADPIEPFLALDDFLEVKISPDGAYYAVTTTVGGQTTLAVLRRADLARTAFVTPKEGQHVDDFGWANSRQVVFDMAVERGPLAEPVPIASLFLLEAEGGEGRGVGHRPLFLIDPLPAEPNHVLVGHQQGRGRVPTSRMDLRTAKFDVRRFREPPLREATYHIDNAHEIRFASGYAFNELRRRIYRREPSGDWVQIHSEAAGDPDTYVLGFSADNRTAYLAVEQVDGPDEVHAYDMASGESRAVAKHERVDVGRTLHSPLTGAVIAVEFHDALPTLVPIVPDDPFVRKLQGLSKAFPGSYVTPVSYTLDGRIGIYSVSSDVNSGEFYRVDHDTGRAVFLAARNARLDPEKMSPMQPVLIRARDGQSLRAFVTRPVGAAMPGPLVLMPHGGPKGVFDSWGFDHETQMLASRGYTVMQVNFRGSGNFGRAFREAGNGQWGGVMIDDLVDATRWAVEQGITIPGRTCAYGASYGAYASLMLLAREPGLFACAIGNVGIYDLDRMYRHESHLRDVRDFLDTSLGNDGLVAISATSLAGRMRGPVLLGAGVDDEIAPLWQTRAMTRALKAAGKPPEIVAYPNERHGYFKPENRRDWARRVLDMLDRTIGPKAGAPGSEPGASR